MRVSGPSKYEVGDMITGWLVSSGDEAANKQTEIRVNSAVE